LFDQIMARRQRHHLTFSLLAKRREGDLHRGGEVQQVLYVLSGQ